MDFLGDLTSAKQEMEVHDQICSSAAELDTIGVNGRLRSKFAVSYCTFCIKL